MDSFNRQISLPIKPDIDVSKSLSEGIKALSLHKQKEQKDEKKARCKSKDIANGSKKYSDKILEHVELEDGFMLDGDNYYKDKPKNGKNSHNEENELRDSMNNINRGESSKLIVRISDFLTDLNNDKKKELERQNNQNNQNNQNKEQKNQNNLNETIFKKIDRLNNNKRISAKDLTNLINSKQVSKIVEINKVKLDSLGAKNYGVQFEREGANYKNNVIEKLPENNKFNDKYSTEFAYPNNSISNSNSNSNSNKKNNTSQQFRERENSYINTRKAPSDAFEINLFKVRSESDYNMNYSNESKSTTGTITNSNTNERNDRESIRKKIDQAIMNKNKNTYIDINKSEEETRNFNSRMGEERIGYKFSNLH